MIDMHHIVSDGISLGVFVEEFMAFYRAQELPPLTIQYRDFTAWRDRPRERASMETQGRYWLDTFKERVTELELPLDFPRPEARRLEGKKLSFDLTPEVTQDLIHLADETEATLYMVLLAIFNILAARLSGQEDVVVGTPVMGRRREALQRIIGMFVNTLPLRNYPKKELTFKEFLKDVKERTLSAFDNQDYPFEELVETLGIEANAGRNPLFDIMFGFQNQGIPQLRIPGLTLTPYPFDAGISKFDLNLVAYEEGDGLGFSLEYATALFKDETASRFITYINEIIEAVVTNPDCKLENIKLSLQLSDAESSRASEASGDFEF